VVLLVINHIVERDNGAKKYWSDGSNHLIRQRINYLLSNAIKNPVIIVCAGARCGKTRAVSDFLRKQDVPSYWVDLYERDNYVSEFWEAFTNEVAHHDVLLGDRFVEIGFPDTHDKMERFKKIRNNSLVNKPGILVLDNFHVIKEPSILYFIEKMLTNELPKNSNIILICRDLSNVNIETLQIRGLISEIHESDLNFNENEIIEYFVKQNLSVESQAIREIYEDTKGWAFAVNLVARSLSRVPNYFGYVKTTLKQNIFKLMEAENWDSVPERLRQFLINLSLIDHLSVELVEILAEGSGDLLRELKGCNAHIRFDNYGGTYLIHHLFLDFLRTKQHLLSDERKRKTYKAAADWCNHNNFKMDALNYYEKIGDYDAIVAVFFTLPTVIPFDIAQYAKGIFDRAPEKTFDCVMYFASMHLNVVVRLGDLQEFYRLADYYENKFLLLSENDAMRRTTLSGIYFCMAMVRAAYAYDGVYDFDLYFEKMFDCMTQEYYDVTPAIEYPRAAWVNLTYSSEKGEPQKYIDAMVRSDKTTARYTNNITVGTDYLIQGELLFYQGNVNGAEPYLLRAIENATKRMAFETLHRALFYLMRNAVVAGEMQKAEAALRDIEGLLNEKKFLQRFPSYDIAYGWYQFILYQPEMFPQWLIERFSPYTHASTMENFGNQVKARYLYLTRNYFPLLSYIKEMRQRESFLFGRIEMFAMEACVHYQMKNKTMAWNVLKEAYETAEPNGIIMPFIELGKGMRTLAAAALREYTESQAKGGIGIPRGWLESVKNKATAYAKSQSMFITKQKLFITNGKALAAREHDILNDLYHGFSQSEIANKRSLSVNTVKMYTKNIYDKLHVHKISDLIRVAAEQGLV
jgi:LuxR family maltose regulon positive regulatory protein